MAVWGVRAGKHGENESYALENNVLVIGWDEIGDVGALSNREQIASRIVSAYPDIRPTTVPIWTGEIWAFKDRIQETDVVVLPLKTRSALAIGRITGPYRFENQAPEGAKQQRSVNWLRTDVPRSEVTDREMLLSLGSTLTVFQVQRPNAEMRMLAISQGTGSSLPHTDSEAILSAEATQNIEENARDQITTLVGRKFRTHDFARLIGEILKADGYKIQVSPPGADGGVDIIAGQGPFGFDPPRMAVQVKSGDSPVDVNVLRQLQGVMPAFGAERGMIVSWGGFRESVIREARRLFFSMRLWDAGDVVSALQECYEKLPTDLQAEIPLKRIWIVTPDD